MTRLEKLRKRLGQCDEILLDAILMRHHIIKDIMAYKEENGLNILDPEQADAGKKAFRLQYRTYRIYGCWKDKYFRIFKNIVCNGRY